MTVPDAKTLHDKKWRDHFYPDEPEEDETSDEGEQRKSPRSNAGHNRKEKADEG